MGASSSTPSGVVAAGADGASAAQTFASIQSLGARVVSGAEHAAHVGALIAKQAAEVGESLQRVYNAFGGKKVDGASGGAPDGVLGLFSGGSSVAVDDLREYTRSEAADRKQSLIRRIAVALKTAGLKLNPELPLRELARELHRVLSANLTSDVDKLAPACKVLADVINNEFGGSAGKVISATEPAEICTQIQLVVAGLAAGMQSELVAIRAEAQAALRRLEIVDGLIARASQNELAAAAKMHQPDTEGAEARRRMADAHDILDRLRKLRQEQEGHLRHILDVTAESADASEPEGYSEKDRKWLLKKLGMASITSNGTARVALGQQFARALGSLSSLALLAHEIDAALKKLNIAADDYYGAASVADLNRVLFGAKRDVDNAGDLATASRLLRDNFSHRRELRAALEGRSDKAGGADADADNVPAASGDISAEDQAAIAAVAAEAAGADSAVPADASGGCSCDLSAPSIQGGADLMEKEKSDVERALDRAKRERYALFREYLESHQAMSGAVVNALHVAAEKVLAGEHEPTAKLDELRSVLTRLAVSDSATFNLQLVGFLSDAAATAARAQFFDLFKRAARLAGEVGTAPFKDLAAAITQMLDNVDYFFAAVKKKFGGADEAVDVNELAVSTAMRSDLELKDATNGLIYAIYMAQMLRRFAIAGKEIASFREASVNVLGDAVAGRIESIMADRDAAVKALGKAPEGNKLVIVDGAEFTDVDADRQTAAKKNYAAAKTFYEQRFAAFKGFYDAAQALELMLSAFTETALMQAREVAGSVLADLSSATVIGQWFSEKSGDQLAEIFDVAAGNDFTGAAAANEYYLERIAAKVALGANSFAGTKPFSAEKALDVCKKSLQFQRGNQAMKNLLNLFARLAAALQKQSSFMSAKQVLDNLQTFVAYAAVAPQPAGTFRLIRAGTDAADADVTVDMIAGASSLNGAEPRQVAGLARVFRLAVADDYKTETDLFFTLMRAVAAKVLLSVRLFSNLKRPSKISQLEPLRITMGGSASHPQVLAEASELYMRLPLLAEFMREMIGWNAAAPAAAAAAAAPAAGDRRISIVPDIEGVFGGFIRAIFLKYGDNQTYTDNEAAELITEINKIYRVFAEKEPENACRAAIDAFIVEINRRIGVVKRADYDKFIEFMKQSRQLAGDASARAAFNNFSILPDEANDSAAKRLAPSDYFLEASGSLNKLKLRPGKYDLDAGDRELVENLQQRLQNRLTAIDVVKYFGRSSFGAFIENSRAQIEKAADDSARLRAACALVQGSASLSSAGALRAMMFHETVVVGLNTLTAMQAAVQDFREFVEKYGEQRLIDLLAVDDIIPAIRAQGAAGTLPAYFASPANSVNGLDLSLFHAVNAGSLPDDNQVQPIRRAVAAGFVDRRAVLLRFLQKLLQLSAEQEGLVKLNFPGGNTPFMLDFSGLQNTIENLADSVTKMLGVFRGLLPKTMIEAYEGASGAGVAPAPGTMAWINENLINRYVRPSLSTGGLLTENSYSFDKLSRGAIEFFNAYSSEYKYENKRYTRLGEEFNDGLFQSVLGVLQSSPARSTNGPAVRAYARAGADGAGWGTPAFAELLDIVKLDPAPEADVSTRASLIAAMWLAPVGYGASFEAFSNLLASGTAVLPAPAFAGMDIAAWIKGPKVDGTTPMLYENAEEAFPGVADRPTRISLPFNSMLENVHDFGLIQRLNVILARYLDAIVDPASRKAYQPLVSAIANSSQSEAVSDIGKAYPDFTLDDNVRELGLPMNGRVLAASLALKTRKLMNSQTQSGLSQHLLSSLAEVSVYMKESLERNLPLFVAAFRQVSKITGTVQQLLRKMPKAGFVALGPFTTAVNAQVAAPMTTNPLPPFRPDSIDAVLRVGKTSDANRLALETIADVLNGFANTLADGAGMVLAELGGETVFFQAGKNAISSYRARNGQEPLMPLSLLMRLFDKPVLYDKNLGSAPFKYGFGVRGIFTQTPAQFEMPGVKHLFAVYNAASESADRIAEDDSAAFGQQVVAAVKFYNSAAHIRGALLGGGRYAKDFGTTGVYELKADVTIESIVNIAESSYQEETVRAITEGLVGSAGIGLVSDRSIARAANVIDMGVMPINIHALLKSIPFIESYVFAGYFSKMLRDAYAAARGINTAAFRGDIDPYLQFMENPAGATLGQTIYSGSRALSMGAPRFLSDMMRSALFVPIAAGREDSTRANVGTAQLAYYNKARELVTKYPDGDLTGRRIIAIGEQRASTILARELIFVAELQQQVRMQLAHALVERERRLLKGSALLADEFTDAGSLETGPIKYEADSQYSMADPLVN